MKEKKVLIFAGTTEGRRLTEYLARRGVSVYTCVATQYGKSLVPDRENVTVSSRCMEWEEMCTLIQIFGPDCVIDATHPFAVEVTANIRKACDRCAVRLLRLVREPADESRDVLRVDLRVDSTRDAVCMLEETKGNILVTTGSKELERYTELSGYRERIYARVLPFQSSIAKCEELGIRGRHLICMQGPFSEEMNKALIKEFDIAWMVTKESGETGGYPQKYKAAKAAGIKLIVIRRPEEEGYTFHEIISILEEER